MVPSLIGPSEGPQYVTRRGGVELVRQKTGIPLSKSTVDKDCHLGRGPKPVAKYGPKHLYEPEEFLRYARARVVKLTPTNVAV
jgi:hypothetical protein